MFREKQNAAAISAIDHQLIDEEHARLAQMLCDLLETCDGSISMADCHVCSKEKVASCQGVLPSFFHDFREFALGHFEHEEKIIVDVLLPGADAIHLRSHREAHDGLMREINRLMLASSALSQQGNVAEAIRQFHQLILDRFGEHTVLFDDPMLQMGATP